METPSFAPSSTSLLSPTSWDARSILRAWVSLPTRENAPGMQQMCNSHWPHRWDHHQPALTQDTPLWLPPSTVIKSVAIHLLSEWMDFFSWRGRGGAVAQSVTQNHCQAGQPALCSCCRGEGRDGGDKQGNKFTQLCHLHYSSPVESQHCSAPAEHPPLGADIPERPG